MEEILANIILGLDNGLGRAVSGPKPSPSPTHSSNMKAHFRPISTRFERVRFVRIVGLF